MGLDWPTLNHSVVNTPWILYWIRVDFVADLVHKFHF